MDRKMGADKIPWQKPELIIFARSRPEESVLVTCKSSSLNGLDAGGGLLCTDTTCEEDIAS